MTTNGIKRLIVAVDNSPLSEACSTAAVSLATKFGAQVVGSHIYAARMHERRFRQMEATLPDRYLEDRELERQRSIHESLISLGLQLISDSYLDELERRCRQAEVPFARKTADGKNWEQLAQEVNDNTYDLMVMGVRGHGTDRANTVGSVCLRVLRHTSTDTLVIKQPDAFEEASRSQAGQGIVVALDGSEESFGGLHLALALGKAYGRPVEAVAAFDPYFHYAVFATMVEVLSPGAARVFKFKEQEQLHEEIIDTGLARLYQTHLDVAEHLARQEKIPLKTTLLTGRAADEVLAYVENARPWLTIVGRIGVHSREQMDIGAVTEHVLRLAPCNVLVASRRVKPPLDLWSDASLRWTQDAEATLNRAPAEYRGTVRLMIHRMAAEEGHTVVTAGLVGRAMSALRPSSNATQEMSRAAATVAAEALRRESTTVYLCKSCGHAAKDQRPAGCPVCAAPGGDFFAVKPAEFEEAVRQQGGSTSEETFDGRQVKWTVAALDALKRLDDPDRQRRSRLRIEKAAHRSKLLVVTEEFAIGHLRALSDNGPGPGRDEGGSPAGNNEVSR